MKQINFTKMHGLGNDFIMIQNLDEEDIDYSYLAKQICDRHFGIGANGLIIAQRSTQFDYLMRMFNPDGSEAETCGNGLVCLVKFLHDEGITTNTHLDLETIVGNVKTQLLRNDIARGYILADMGEPTFYDARYLTIPPSKKKWGDNQIDFVVDYPLSIGSKTYKLTFVSIASPHVVILDHEYGDIDIGREGRLIGEHKYFPEKTNVQFVDLVNRNELNLRAWERGDGVTLACGTGSCAAVVASVLKDKTDRNVKVHNPGGDLDIRWSEKNNHIYMTGPAETVCKGIFYLK